ncbi:AMP-binding protein [Bifidobacterium sp. DSM 109958]|uniref:AMP-binding protein n=1 Tax=Bifidobacterium moraviense TaxID=2675323 RepID=A0A7Y0F2D2_9BIFI|nr:long-chain fatty acid--CoA ligase [Bifidobacterium sp. DSM 109958]NMM99821.1 AMP-binding protein [Bifidobacterium sp. DSM 109958]
MLKEFVEPFKITTTDDDTVFSLLERRAERGPDDLIAQWQDDETHRWHDVTAGQMLDRVRLIAKGLMALGATKGERVIVYSPTCYSWGVVDFACAAIGAVLVPIYETDSVRQAAAIVDEVEPVVAFCGDFEHAQALEQIRDSADNTLRYVFNFRADGLDAVADFGRAVSDADLDAAIADVKADDLLTIVYTSGSTGRPKGAMLSNRNYTHIVLNGYEILPNMLYNDNRLLLFLPLAHCFARYIQYVAIGGHGVIGYIPGAKRLLADLRSFKPTYLLGVPRVFEKVYNAASQKAGAGIRGRIFSKAFSHFVRWSKDGQEGRGHSLASRIEHSFFMATVGSSVRDALGPNLRFLACGGAPINVDLAHFFNGMDGITFIQGYGMTETAAPMMVNWEDDNEVGSVGKPGPGMGVRVAEDGELEVCGPNVFMGYWRNPRMTAEVMDGPTWLRTGDLGEIDDHGFVFITGRKKDIIITAGGKNISPAPMEDIIDTCPIVQHAVVVGDGRPFVSALIELEPDMLRSWLAGQGLDADMPLEEAKDNDAVRAFIQQYVDKANAGVSRAESVRKFAVLTDQFNQDDGTLTPSLKVVRAKVLRRYADVIEHEIYVSRSPQPPTPATVKIIDRTAETVQQVSESMRQASENVSPMVRQALDQARANVSDSLASVQGRMKPRQGDGADGESDARTADADDAGAAEARNDESKE